MSVYCPVFAAFPLNPRIREDGGAEGIRTPDPHNAIVVLYQLSYDPTRTGAQNVESPTAGCQSPNPQENSAPPWEPH